MSQLMKVKIMNEKQPIKIKATSNFPTVNVGGTTDHSKLKNLDYAHSGHTGFASSEDLESKVDKVSGKQLSTEDYTTEEKAKLSSLENYTLPTASTDTLGGVKIGENLNIDENGVLSASGGGSGSISPIIIGEAELKELHDTYTPALAKNQIWAGAVYLKYGDGLFYCNTSFSMGWGKYASSDYGDIGSVILVTQQGKCIFHFLSHKSNAMKVFSSSSTITERSTYNTTTIAGNKLYTLIHKTENDKVMYTDNTSSYTPTSNYNPSTKLYTDKTHYEKMAGYDASKTQVLKNIQGVLTWETIE